MTRRGKEVLRVESRSQTFDKGFVRPGMISPEETLQKLGARRGLIKVEKCPPTPVPNQFWVVIYVPGREQVQINV